MEHTIESPPIKKIAIGNIVSTGMALITALAVCFSFYYKTTFVQESQSENIQSLHKDVGEIKEQINSAIIYNGVSTAEINNVKKDVVRIEATLIRVEEKMDRMLVIAKNIEKTNN